MAEEKKGWTKDQLLEHIKRVVGEEVARIVGERSTTETNNAGAAVDNAGGGDRVLRAAGTKGLIFAGCIAALAAGAGDVNKALAFAKTMKNEEVVRALEAGTAEGGGILIAPQHSQDFIDLLTARAVVRSFNPTIIPMDSGSIDVPKLTAASTASYIGEVDDVPASQQKFGSRILTAKKLAALVPVSNTLLRRGGPKVQTIVRNDSLRAISLKEDATFIRGVGTQFSPKGLRHWAPASNVIPANGTVNLTNITADLGKLILALEEANVPLTNPGWIIAPRTKFYLMTVRDANGNFAFRDEMLRGQLWGFPYRSTTTVPKNLGGGSNESEIYLVDFDESAIGEASQLSVAISTEAAFIENGQLVSAFSKDLTIMRVILEHDFAMRHDEAVAVLTGVTWGV